MRRLHFQPNEKRQRRHSDTESTIAVGISMLWQRNYPISSNQCCDHMEQFDARQELARALARTHRERDDKRMFPGFIGGQESLGAKQVCIRPQYFGVAMGCIEMREYHGVWGYCKRGLVHRHVNRFCRQVRDREGCSGV